MTRIALVCLSPLKHDSRVLRHAALLVEAGYDVRIFAQAPLPASYSGPVTVLPGPGSDTRVRLGMLLKQAPASILSESADLLYWLSPTKLVARRELLRFWPDLVIANDWRALPIALIAKRLCGARVIYDSHEFASEEFADSWHWRLLARQHVARIEGQSIGAADAVVTVSEGIADALVARYGQARPTVILNTPTWHATAFRPTGKTIDVLYHGAVVPRRGLETLIASVPFWPGHYRLVIRGPAQGGFDQKLRSLASSLANRVIFEAAVAPDRVISAASEADIGIFLLSNSTIHARFAMPNKIFEYMQAGLMVISSNLPEIRKLVNRASCGIILDGDRPRAIAMQLAALTPEMIDCYKQASLVAARSLNFENEGEKLLRLIDQLL